MNGSAKGPTFGIARRVLQHPAGALRVSLNETWLTKRPSDDIPLNRTDQVRNEVDM
ncbi:MAG: hypothetical protein AMXMBFR57_31230 [Acidimicrobiia bacterium]